MKNVKIKLLKIREQILATDPSNPINASVIVGRLAEEGISCERKSVSRDIATLKASGIDIHLHRDKRKGWYCDNRLFEPWEIKFLCDAANSASFITKDAATSICKRLKEFLSVSYRSIIDDSLPLRNPRGQAPNKNLAGYVGFILDAIADNEKISFKMKQLNKKFLPTLRNNGRTYVVSPFALYINDNYYYLVGILDGDERVRFRSFRIDRIQQPQRLDVSTPRVNIEHLMRKTPAKAINDYINNQINLFSGEPAYVTIEAPESLADLITDRYGTKLQPKITERGFEVEIKTVHSQGLIQELLSMGSHIKVIKSQPPELKEEYLAEMRKALAQYD